MSSDSDNGYIRLKASEWGARITRMQEAEDDCIRLNNEKMSALERAIAAEARAERLRVALVQFNNHFGPLADNEMLHPEARKCFHLARKALSEDDKQ